MSIIIFSKYKGLNRCKFFLYHLLYRNFRFRKNLSTDNLKGKSLEERIAISESLLDSYLKEEWGNGMNDLDYIGVLRMQLRIKEVILGDKENNADLPVIVSAALLKGIEDQILGNPFFSRENAEKTEISGLKNFFEKRGYEIDKQKLKNVLNKIRYSFPNRNFQSDYFN